MTHAEALQRGPGDVKESFYTYETLPEEMRPDLGVGLRTSQMKDGERTTWTILGARIKGSRIALASKRYSTQKSMRWIQSGMEMHNRARHSADFVRDTRRGSARQAKPFSSDSAAESLERVKNTSRKRALKSNYREFSHSKAFNGVLF